VALAAALDVTLAFAALLSGYGLMGGMKSTEQARFRMPMQSISDVAGFFFVPVYFALIGYRLDLSKTFDPLMLGGFMIGTSIVAIAAVGLGAKLAGMNRLDIINIAITQNARGGPGIVMASVAFDAGIINAPFFTTLVLTAVLTSQACGFWLDYVLRKGWPLLSGDDLRKRGMDAEDEDLPNPALFVPVDAAGAAGNGEHRAQVLH
ncbi:MAG: cation:proton antiporter, partial [Acidimicrobiia bacterium]